MPREKAARNIQKKVSRRSKLQSFKLSDSYISLFLGVLVVVIVALIGFAFVRLERGNKETGQVSSTSTVASTGEKQGSKNSNLPEKYTVKSGDDLWSISLKIYGSGYNWVDIAKANNLTEPNTIYSGALLNIPNVKPLAKSGEIKSVEASKAEAIKAPSYTVNEGDNLWEIAVRSYGDGYKWVDLARENKLENPSLIYPGDIFKIPR
ncbi:MAG: LysM peptidoglycan-binding domain-containing protein [Candidatus Levybacteria bacterium]|nr:LysM peptidoglycan-binding domain-containing protein [Candidatus Levybacteria bacterium]